MLHVSEFRVQKYADKGGFPVSLNPFPAKGFPIDE